MSVKKLGILFLTLVECTRPTMCVPVVPAWHGTDLPGQLVWTLVQQGYPCALPQYRRQVQCHGYTVYIRHFCFHVSCFVVPWYFASWAMRSPALSLARRGLSCNLKAHCLTRMSSSNVDAAIRKASPAPDLLQKKTYLTFMFYAQTSELAGFWIIFNGAFVTSQFSEVLFCCTAVCKSRAIWLCEARMLPQCPDPHPVVTVLVFLSGNWSCQMLQESQTWSCILPPRAVCWISRTFQPLICVFLTKNTFIPVCGQTEGQTLSTWCSRFISVHHLV